MSIDPIEAVARALCRKAGFHPDYRLCGGDNLKWIDFIDEAESALAAATGTAKTPKAVECEASQSGPTGNAQPPQEPTHEQ